MPSGSRCCFVLQLKKKKKIKKEDHLINFREGFSDAFTCRGTHKRTAEVLFVQVQRVTHLFDIINGKGLGMDPYQRLFMVSEEIEIIPDDDSSDFPARAEMRVESRQKRLSWISSSLNPSPDAG